MITSAARHVSRWTARAALFGAALLGPAGAAAQGLGVSAVVLDARHRLLGDPLVGVGAAVWVPLPEWPLTLRVGAEWLRGRTERTGIPCAGLVMPGTCAPERVRDDARLTSAGVGAALRVLGGRRAALALTADVVRAWVRSDTRGLGSGRALAADKALWGGLAGAQVTWAPAERVPLALELGGAVGGLMPMSREIIADGYTPFNAGFDVTRWRLGVAWRGAAPSRP